MSEAIDTAAVVQGAVQGLKAEASAPGVTGTEAPSEMQSAPETENAESVQPTEVQPDFAEGFARLKKKERMLREREREYHNRIKELESRAKIAEELDRDPMAVLSQKGWTLDKLLERVATGEDPKPTVEDKVSELQKKLDQLEQAKQEAEAYAKAQAEQKVVAEYKNQIKTIVDTGDQNFEAIRTLGAYDLVFTTAEQYYQENGEIPEIAKVAEAVETHLTKQLEMAFKLKKFESKRQPVTAETPEIKQSAQAQEKRIPGAQTLTAQQTAVSKPPNSGKLLSPEESLREAAKLIRWT